MSWNDQVLALTLHKNLFLRVSLHIFRIPENWLVKCFLPQVLKTWFVFIFTCYSTTLLFLLGLSGFWIIFRPPLSIMCVSVCYFPFTEACVTNSLFTMADIRTAILHTLPSHTHFLLQGFISKLPIVYGPLDLTVQGQSHFLHSLNTSQKS